MSLKTFIDLIDFRNQEYTLLEITLNLNLPTDNLQN